MADWGKVDDITEIRLPDKQGDVKTFYRYRVTTKGGVTFTMMLPEEVSTPEKVAPILEKRAKELDKIRAL